MEFQSSLQTPENPEHVEFPTIECVRCHSAKDLTLESIQPAKPKASGWVCVEYSCGECESFYAHAAPVASVAQFLATSETPSGVLQFGRYYIHCGEPMEKTRIELSRSHAFTAGLDDAPAIRLSSVVLRCHCGFQMTIPQ